MPNWFSLSSPSGQLPFDTTVAVATNADGRLEVFAIENGVLWHNWQVSWRGGWSGWFSLGQPIPQGIGPALAVGVNGDSPRGRLEAFTADSTGGLWHIWQLTPGGGWSRWFSLAANVADPPYSMAVANNFDQSLELITLGNGVGHIWQLIAGGGWSGWFSLGGPPQTSPAGQLMSPIAVARDSANQLQVFVTHSDPAYANGFQVWNTGQVGPRGGWSSWSSLDAPPPTGGNWSGVVVGTNQNGTLELFIGGFDGNVWHRWQQQVPTWYPLWSSLGSPVAGVQPNQYLPAPAVQSNLSGTLEIFVAGLRNTQVWHNWQTAPESGWNGWADLGMPPQVSDISPVSLAVGVNGDGSLELFAVAGGALWHVWQNTPGGAWS